MPKTIPLFLRHVEDMVKVFRDDLKFINVFVILFKETDMRLDKVSSLHSSFIDAKDAFFAPLSLKDPFHKLPTLRFTLI